MTDLKSAADALDVTAMEQANALSLAETMPFPVAWAALVAEFIKRAKERSPQAIADADGRAARWRVRVRLYNDVRPDEPEADSDPDLPPEAMGVTILNGLPAVAEHLATLASVFHCQAPAGLDDATLRHRLKSLRPTISRRGGDAVWRVPYKIFQAGDTFHGDTREQTWLARVDVERVTA